MTSVAAHAKFAEWAETRTDQQPLPRGRDHSRYSAPDLSSSQLGVTGAWTLALDDKCAGQQVVETEKGNKNG